jgi:serine/threonine protein kinase
MINQLIGNYRITAALAEGGMGQVYRARHQDLPREVVVKTIRLASFQAKDQEHLKARFLREAYIQSQLDHGNVVRVYEFIRTEENFYLVMEFIDGMSLSDLIRRRGAIDPQHVIPLLRQALEGLSYAHKFSYLDEAGNRLAGIIHRDIKPANLLLDGMGRLKITDFGIVKLVGESGMTMTGFNPGTVEYMSPEQIRGLQVDARSDIYSLGVTFYEALSGRLPFPPSDTGSTYEVMRGHTELIPPSLREIMPQLPVALAGLMMRSLEKDPAKRYQSADEWLDAINAYQGGADHATGTEVIAPPPASGGTEVLTEALSQPTSTSSIPARPSSPSESYATEVISSSTTRDSAPTTRAPAPTRQAGDFETRLSVPKTKGMPAGAIIAGALLLLVIAAGITFLMLRPSVPTTTGASAEPPASPAAPPSPIAAAEDARLVAAREAEEAERYAEAIRLYEEYLAAHPNGSQAVSKQLTAIKAFNGHLQMAKVWMDQGDFAEAKKDYAAALKSKPASKMAKAGLEAADARLRK